MQCFSLLRLIQVTNLVTPIVPHYTKLYQGALSALSAASIISVSPTEAGRPAGTSSIEQVPSLWHRYHCCVHSPNGDSGLCRVSGYLCSEPLGAEYRAAVDAAQAPGNKVSPCTVHGMQLNASGNLVSVALDGGNSRHTRSLPQPRRCGLPWGASSAGQQAPLCHICTSSSY